MQPELASKFFELLKSADKPLEDIETAIVSNELNPQDLPIEKVLIGAALENIKKNSLQNSPSKMASDMSRTGSNDINARGRHQNFRRNLHISSLMRNIFDKDMVAQAVIDTTVFESFSNQKQ